MKKAFSCMLIVIMLISLTSCWGYMDLSELSLASALGIDIDQQGQVIVSVQIVKSSAAKKSEGGGGSDKGTVVLSNTDDTVFAALRGLLKKVNNKIFFSSAQVIVIGEEAAKAGVKDYLDFILRDHETQYKALVVVAKGTTANEILKQEYGLTKVPGNYIHHTLKNAKSTGFTEEMALLEVARELLTQGRDLSLPTIEKVGEGTETEGHAVFLGDKLVGFLDKYETRGYMFATGRIKNVVMDVKNPFDQNKSFLIETMKASEKRKVEWGENKLPKIIMDIKVEANIGEIMADIDIGDKEVIKRLENACDEMIKGEVLKTVKKCKELKCDTLGLGMKVIDKEYEYWQEIKDQWNTQIYPNIEVEVNVKTKLLGSGLIGKSLKIE